MRILVHDFSGHPFQIQLSRALAARGDDVLHAYCGDILTPEGSVGAPSRRPGRVPRARSRARYASSPSTNSDGAWSTSRATRGGSRASVREFRPDVVLLSNDPPVARLLAVQACRRAGVPVVLWLQDLYALGLSLLFRQRLGPLASAPTLVANSLERRALRGCAAIVVIGKEFIEPVRRDGARADAGALHRELGTTLGSARSAEGEPAELPARPRPALRLPLLGHAGVEARHRAPARAGRARSGPGPTRSSSCAPRDRAREHVAAEARDRGLTTTRVIEYQPYERLPELLGAADVLVAVLGRNAALHSVPSKVLTYHAAARPDPCRDRARELRRRVHHRG